MTRAGASTDNVVINGYVINRGSLPFVSRPGQQVIELFEGDRKVRTLPFDRLDPGEVIEISFERPRTGSDVALPAATVVITYDPDIFTDGLDTNDDANMENNRLQIRR